MPHSTQHRKELRPSGFGQLTLVEHALCPLNHETSLVENLVHQATYRYTENKRRKTAHVKVLCPLGLSASDEIYLWGLLALTLSQSDERPDLVATPHWCLRQLGIVGSGADRGGEQYRSFRDALRRLSVTSYLCDGFYDPQRAEHREVSFHFFSYTRPTDQCSSRAWRLSWDETFLAIVRHGASGLRFDLELYRELDPATRRLFLFASKILYRREFLPQLDLKHLANDVLGYAPTVAARDLRVKVLRCLKRLESKGVVRDFSIERIARNRYVVNARRGPHFERPSVPVVSHRDLQPVIETLLGIGFDNRSASRLIRRYPIPLLEEWADITLAKLERQGQGSFRRSPMAYFVDAVSKAHEGKRTPPDWWNDIRREEQKQADLSAESQKLLSSIRSELFNASPDKGSSDRASTGVSSAGEILKSSG